jgi:Xaa-Pro dipeptidase
MGPQPRQRRYFYYITGANDADCYVTYQVEHDQLILWVPNQRTQREILYMGPVVTPESARVAYDVDDALYARNLNPFVREFLASGRGTLYLLHPDDAVPNLHAPLTCLDHASDPGAVDTTSLVGAMNACRCIKDDWEIDAIRKANCITAAAHVEVLKHISAISTEAAVEGIYIGTCIAGGAKSQAYAPIAGSGPNAATLHYGTNNDTLVGRQLVLLDAGAEWSCYACDVTRTFPTRLSPNGGWPSKEAAEIYDLVREMQDSCITQMKPGVLFRHLDMLAHVILVKGLLKLGILHNGTDKDIIAAGTSAAFLPHGLGHHLGLEVHDVDDEDSPMLVGVRGPGGDVERDTSFTHMTANSRYHGNLCFSTAGLRKGMVVTVEPGKDPNPTEVPFYAICADHRYPGIYFNSFAFDEMYFPSPVHSKFINRDVLSKYMAVGGVRIEDDILITANGHENLTTTPKGAEALEIIKQGPKYNWTERRNIAVFTKTDVVLASPPRRIGIQRRIELRRINGRVGSPIGFKFLWNDREQASQ